jgi:RHS repeat-associated protein
VAEERTQAGTTTKQVYFHAGSRVVVETNEAYSVERECLFGYGVDEVELSETPGGGERYPLQDVLASVWRVVSAQGAVATSFDYGAYGETTRSGSAFPYGFNGRRYDADHKLYDYRARFYDPELGRFLSRDPLGIWGDGVGLGNGYAYVGNNPANRTDPFGLGPEEPGGTAPSPHGGSTKPYVPPVEPAPEGSSEDEPDCRRCRTVVAPWGPCPDGYRDIVIPAFVDLGGGELPSVSNPIPSLTTAGHVLTPQGRVPVLVPEFDTLYFDGLGPIYSIIPGLIPDRELREFSFDPVGWRLREEGKAASGPLGRLGGQNASYRIEAREIAMRFRLKKMGVHSPGAWVEFHFMVGMEVLTTVAFAGIVKVAGTCFRVFKEIRRLKQAATAVARNANAYEVLTEQAISGTSRSAHRAAANRALLSELQGDPALRAAFDELLGGDVARHMSSGKSGLRNPPGTVWHHPANNPGTVQLLKSAEHTNPSLQHVLHPDGIGGYGRFYDGP